MEIFKAFKNIHVIFLIGVFNSVNLRPSVDLKRIEKDTTKNHTFICSTGRENSVPGITYDERGRYYSISHHGVCPHPVMKDWKCNADYKQCKNGTTYHCARDSITGSFTDGCASPVFCGRGKEPLLRFPEGVPQILCRFCGKNHFNTANKSSDTYTGCSEKIRCRQLDQIECEADEGDASHWTQRRCTCNWKMNFIPTDLESRKAPYDFCLLREYAKCAFYECAKTTDGKRQERLSNYSCVPMCDPGSHRINESNECVSLDRKSTVNVTVHETSTATKKLNSSSSINTPTLEISANTTTPTIETSSNTDPKGATKIKGSNIANDVIIIILAIIILALVFAVMVLVICWCWKKKRQRSKLYNTNAPGTPTVMESTHNRITIHWDKPPTPGEHGEAMFFFDKYTVECMGVNTGLPTREKKIQDNYCTFDELQSETDYKFRVATYHKTAGKFSGCSAVITTKPSAVEIIADDIKDVEKVRDQPFSIVVPYRGTPSRVEWTKDGLAVEEEDGRLLLKNDGLKATLKNVSSKRNDTGTYEIKLKNNLKECKYQLKVNIKDLPGIPIGPLEVGNTGKDECVLKWKQPEDDGGCNIEYIVETRKKDGEWCKVTNADHLHVPEYTFKLTCDQLEYSFRVKAKNERGEGQPLEMEKPFVLIWPQVENENMNVDAKEGRRFEITVPYESVPKPDVKWTKNYNDLQMEANRLKLDESHKKVSLFFHHATKTDAGLYRVILSNVCGQCEVSINVSIKYKPDKPEGPLRITEHEDIYILEWKPPVDFGGSAIEYIVENYIFKWSEIAKTKTTSCSITRADIKHKIRVFARNDQGDSGPLELPGTRKILQANTENNVDDEQQFAQGLGVDMRDNKKDKASLPLSQPAM